MSAHTPLPWRIYRDSLPAVVSGTDDDDTFRYVAQDMTEADGAFIVHSANCHDDLLAACEAALRSFKQAHACRHLRSQTKTSDGNWCECDTLRAAIAKARGGA